MNNNQFTTRITVLIVNNGHQPQMATENYSVSSYFIRTHLANTVRLGGNEQGILKKVSLTPELLKEPRIRASPLQLAIIVRASWEVSGDELMGLASHKIKVGVFALLAERLISCKTLGDVLSEVSKFYNLITEALCFTLTEIENQSEFSVTLSNQEAGDNSMLIEFLLLIWHRFPSWLVGQSIPLSEICFEYAEPSHSDEYRLMFPCACHYLSGKNAIIFDTALLQMPVCQPQEELEKYLAEIPLQWFKKQVFHGNCTAHVMRMLEGSKIQEETSLEHIAETMHMTSRTLRRKLTAEGASFQQLKDNVRRDNAIHMLGDFRTPIAEIGRQIGFTEAAAFTRAFKQWTGVAPGIYRKGLYRQTLDEKSLPIQSFS